MRCDMCEFEPHLVRRAIETACFTSWVNALTTELLNTVEQERRLTLLFCFISNNYHLICLTKRKKSIVVSFQESFKTRNPKRKEIQMFSDADP